MSEHAHDWHRIGNIIVCSGCDQIRAATREAHEFLAASLADPSVLLPFEEVID